MLIPATNNLLKYPRLRPVTIVIVMAAQTTILTVHTIKEYKNKKAYILCQHYGLGRA